jgi:hypothetical protein
MALAACTSPVGVYRPRRPLSSPLYRLLTDHFEHFRGQYEDVFEHEYGRWRRVVDTVVGRYLDCGVLEAGFARVRCADCAAEYLLAFSCKTRYFCPSCHAKRLAAWTVWLDDELLAPVPHRQMVFVLPKRLRPYFQWRRKLLGDLARIAARTATAFVRATLDEPDVSVGIVMCIQTHGSLLNWQPHIHALVTDGGFRPDGTFVSMPAHSTDVLTEAFRRAVLKLFVDRELFEPEVADNMLDWMHSGFSVHDSVWLDQDDAPAQARLARYCARCPVSLERLEYDAQTGTVEYTSDKDHGPTAGRYTFEPTAFIARLVAHIPEKGQALQRYYGYYANRTRGERRKVPAGVVEPIDGDNAMGGADLPLREVTIVEPEAFNRAEARHRWAELLRLIYEVDPLVCPRCGGPMRVVALIQDPKVIDKILRHLRAKGSNATAGPWATGPPPSASHQVEAA